MQRYSFFANIHHISKKIQQKKNKNAIKIRSSRKIKLRDCPLRYAPALNAQYMVPSTNVDHK